MPLNTPTYNIYIKDIFEDKNNLIIKIYYINIRLIKSIRFIRSLFIKEVI